MKRLGTLVPIVTPCSKSGQLDKDGIKSVCNYFINAGAHGIFILGSTGRGPWFNSKDKSIICSTAANAINSKVPLFAGCMGLGLEEIVENTRMMADSGATVAVLTSPCYFTYSYQELESIFLQVADASPLPVMIYDIPDFTGAKLNTDMISRLAGHENIIGFKDSSGDIKRFNELRDTLNDNNEYYLIQGKELLLAESILNGASGFTVSLIHLLPAPFIDLYNSAIKGDIEKTKEYQDKINRVFYIINDCFKRKPEISTLFHFLNYSLEKHGVCENITLDYEGSCPDWLEEQSEKAIDVLL